MTRHSIATRYAALVVALLCCALTIGGAVEVWTAHRERLTALEALQREKAQSAAQAVSRVFDDLRRSLDWATLAAPAGAGDAPALRRLELLKLLRLEPAITTATLVDASGIEQVRASRIEPDRVASGVDWSHDSEFVAARAGRTAFSSVHFLAQTEPHLTVAAPSAGRDGGVILADVNLKFVWNVVSQIKVGQSGYAYVVDQQGRLVSHPNISLVLQMTDLSRLPQVQAAIAMQGQGFDADGRDPDRVPVLAAHAAIAPLAWTVFVEQPRAEAFAPLAASVGRGTLILSLALAMALAAGVWAARRMVAPIAELRRGAERFGGGDLSHRIEITSGDELQELADQFNTMAERLSETYADLERRVAQRTRQLDQANRAQSRFLAVASHDLRQPMHAMALFVDQLRTSRSAEEHAVLTQRVEDAARSLSGLLDQLLDLSRLEAGLLQAAPIDFDAADVLSSIEAQFASLARAKGIELRVRSRHVWLRSDPVLVQRILMNLVANAIQCTERGGVLVSVRQRNGRQRLAVWDTGCGIPEDQRDEVFREFVRLGHAGAQPDRGLGLGLAIVARLVEVLGTRVELQSTVGRGSVIGFDLPAGTASADSPPAVKPVQFADLRGTFVWVIDDEEPARAAMCGLLESWGCLTLAAANGYEALAQLDAHDRPPELIVCDYRLAAGEDGLALIARIRAAVGEPVPALIVTADTTAAATAAARAAQVPLLHKPTSPVKLRALLTQLLKRAGKRDSAMGEGPSGDIQLSS